MRHTLSKSKTLESLTYHNEKKDYVGNHMTLKMKGKMNNHLDPTSGNFKTESINYLLRYLSKKISLK